MSGEQLPYGARFAAIYNDKWDLWSRRVWPLIVPHLPEPATGRRWLDLCCGTGGLLQLAAHRGFDVTGVDRSPFQLFHAAIKAPDARLVESDIEAFSETGRFDVVTCMFDSLNYLVRRDAIDAVLANVRTMLAPDGVFLFDIKTEEGFRRDEDRVFRTDAWVAIFEGSYDAASALHRLQVTGFAKEPTGSYARFDELHEQRAYEASDVDGWVEAAGLASQRIDFDEGGPPSSSTGRLFYACRPR